MIGSIRARDVAGLLDSAPPGIRLLSLDCFDTLIWRNTNAPMDVFADLAIAGGGLQPRLWAESTVRRLAHTRDRRLEIALKDVYRRLYPAADEARLDELVAAELAIEAGHAFAFMPVVRLMEEARRRGLPIVIVSDMYLSEAQLRAHIAGAAGDDVLAMVDRVFVSSDHGRGKCDGLFATMLKAMRVAPAAVLHLGDNHAADYEAARRHGLNAVHLQQFDRETEARLRQEAVAAAMIDPAARATRAVCQPHRAAAALRRDDEAATVLGHDVLGPVLHTFALWLKAELDAAAERLGRPVRPLFMLRDGHLPFRMFEQLYPDAGARAVEISRFAATRASLSEPAALDSYLGEWLHRLPIRTLARQLMLHDREVEVFTRRIANQRMIEDFARFVSLPDTRRKIQARAEAFAAKLVAHLAAAGVAQGDAVMLVDVGYNGTVQNLLTPVLAKRMGLTVGGRYLFLREAEFMGLDKQGLLDVAQHDCRALHGMASCVVVLEQLCNLEQGSTIDYADDGTPIREAVDGKAAHNDARDAVQRACLDYAATLAAGIRRAPASDTLATRRAAAAATLARLFFLPGAREIALLDGFHHDANMGTSVTGKLFDLDAARARTRRRGMMFLDERPRAFPAAEMKGAGMAASLALFASSRLALDLRGADFEVGGIDVPVMMATASDHHVTAATAFPTTDGYYRLCVPIGEARPTIGIQLGAPFEIVEIDEVEYLRMEDLDPGVVRAASRPMPATVVPDACEPLAPDLYRLIPTSLLMVLPPDAAAGAAVLSLVFRPIRARGTAQPLRAVS